MSPEQIEENFNFEEKIDYLEEVKQQIQEESLRTLAN